MMKMKKIYTNKQPGEKYLTLTGNSEFRQNDKNLYSVVIGKCYSMEGGFSNR